MIAPTSSDERIRQVADIADSFIYVVSTLGVTGSRASVDSDLPALVQRIKNITQIPLAVGFGVSSRNQFEYVGSIAEGVVIGSRLINLLKNTPIEIVGNAIQEFSLQVTNRKKEDILKSIDSLQKIQRSPNTPNIMTKVSSDVNGRYGDFGGRYVAELLVGCLDEIEQVTS